MSNCGSKRKMAYGGKVKKMKEGGMSKMKPAKPAGKVKPVDKEKNPGLAKLPTEVRNKMGFMKKGGMTKKKAPKGMHYMPDGTLMKDSEHKKKSKKMMYGGTVKKMKSGGSTGNFGDAFQPKTPKERKAAAIDKVKRENKSQSNQERKKECQRKLKAVHSRVSKNMMKSGGTVKKMKHGGMAKCKRDGIAMRGRTRAGK